MLYFDAYEPTNVYGLRRGIMISMKYVLNESFKFVLGCFFSVFLEFEELEGVGLSFIIKTWDFAVKK